MNIKIFWKLFFLFTSIVAALLLGLYLYLTPFFKDWIIQESQKRLTEDLHLVHSALKERHHKSLSVESLDSFVDELSQNIESRLTFIASDGQVLGDSDLSLEEIKTIDNHLERLEILQANTQGVGWSLRFSDTLKTDMLYVALKIPEGYIRLAYPLKKINKILAHFKKTLLIALWGTLIVGLSAFLFFILKTGQFLKELIVFSQRISSGDFSHRITQKASDERGVLSDSLNNMAQSLQIIVERIEKDRNRFQSVLESIHEGVLVTNSEGRISLANQALRRQFCKDSDPKSKTPLEYFQNHEIHKLVQDTLEKKVAYQKEIYVQNSWIDKRFHVFAAPVSNDYGSVSVFYDITQIRKLENVRREFVTNVSHEFKTPLTSILGYSETILNSTQDLDETQTRFIKIIQRNARHLKELVDDTLQLSRIESGQFELSMQSLDVHAVLRRVMTDYVKKAHDRSIKIELNFPSTALFVKADETSLYQIFSNLVDNAIKYSSSGGLVKLSTQVDQGQTIINVSDTGIGMTASEIERIFERFYRVDPSRSEVEGTGLGLSIVKHLVQSLSAEINVKSEPQKGTTFSVVFQNAMFS